MWRNANMNTKESMVNKRKVQDGEVVNEGDEGGRGEGIVNNTSTPTMRPTSKELRTRKVGETVQDHKPRGLPKLQKVAIITGNRSKNILRNTLKTHNSRINLSRTNGIRATVIY